MSQKYEVRGDIAKAVLESAPTNVILADSNFVITYINPSTFKTLKKVEQHLPIKVEEIVGSSIDIFHKHPEHQRKLLRDPSNLPHKARINIGPEVAELLVSAIYDGEGNYAGPMVTWDLVTASEQLKERIGELSGTLSVSSEELSSVSQELLVQAEKTSSDSTSASERAQEINESLQSVAAGTEELSLSIQEISRNSTQTAQSTLEAVSLTNATNEVFKRLRESTEKISSVVNVINTIAGQTNLLALNATIEAAGAGEAGRGFAVVAQEVKALAQGTSQSTNEIHKVVSSIQDNTKEAVEALQKLGKLVTDVSDIANSLASAVEEQSATTKEMSRNVTEAADQIKSMVGSISQVANNSASTQDGALQTNQASAELAKMASELKSLLN